MNYQCPTNYNAMDIPPPAPPLLKAYASFLVPVPIFDANETLNSVARYFSQHNVDFALVVEGNKPAGTITPHELIEALYAEKEFLEDPINRFLSSTTHVYCENETLEYVLEQACRSECPKIIVTDQDQHPLGVLDTRCLLTPPPSLNRLHVFQDSLPAQAHPSFEQLMKLATTDPLTGIANRRFFEDMFHTFQAAGKRYRFPLFLLIFDIDDFKQINDSFGHNTGDSVLRELAALVQRNIRQSDIFARWGGDEFLILFHAATWNNAHAAAKQLQHAISGFSFDSRLHVSCSCGLARVHSDDTLDKALSRTDSALYHAKKNGKNRIGQFRNGKTLL